MPGGSSRSANRSSSMRLDELRELRERDAVLSVRSAELVERMKELDCLLAISRAQEDRRASLDEILERLVREVPKAWRFPEMACVRVTVEGAVHQGGPFERTVRRIEEPLVVRGRQVGALAVGYDQLPDGVADDPFLPEERRLLGALASRVADIVSLKAADRELDLYQDRLRSLAAELAATEERERRQIAQYLHDHIGQLLAVIRLRLDVLRTLAVDVEARGHVDEVALLVGQVIGDVRSLTYQVSPPILHELGLGPALEWLGEQLSRRFNLRILVTVQQGLPDVDDVVGGMLFRSVGELLTNVAKHAKARQAIVTVGRVRGRVRVEVADDGVGLDVSRIPALAKGRECFGLFSIRERLEYLGGRMTVRSAPGAGATVVLDAPPRASRGRRAQKGAG